jgi:hypothetical protein
MSRSAWIRTASGMAFSCIMSALTIALASQVLASEVLASPAMAGQSLPGQSLAGQTATQDRMISTTVRNGNSVATVTQSGDPATASHTVEKRPGYTRIEQQSGNSRSVVIQSTNPADFPAMPGLDALPPDLRRMFEE